MTLKLFFYSAKKSRDFSVVVCASNINEALIKAKTVLEKTYNNNDFVNIGYEIESYLNKRK